MPSDECDPASGSEGPHDAAILLEIALELKLGDLESWSVLIAAGDGTLEHTVDVLSDDIAGQARQITRASIWREATGWRA